MDLCSEMLAAHLKGDPRLALTSLRPRYQHPFGFGTLLPGVRGVRSASRLWNRFAVYPGYLRRRASSADLFHLVDHSYGQLLHYLPPRSAGVFCHDLDTFECLLQPNLHRRSALFRSMTRRVFSGFLKARWVFYSNRCVGDRLASLGLFARSQLIEAPLGVSAEFHPDARSDSPDDSPSTNPYLLHVGSCIPRKRADILLKVFAAVSHRYPELRLVQVGGDWTAEQRHLIDALGIASRVSQYRGIPRAQIAEYMRRSAIQLQTSEAEGFGLPIIEGLACGARIIASDIEVFREVAGNAILYAPVADVDAWVEMITSVLNSRIVFPPLEQRLQRASRYSWAEHARIIAETYLNAA